MLKCLDISNYDLYWIKKIKFKISKVFTLLGCKDVGIRKFEFVATTQFLYATLVV